MNLYAIRNGCRFGTWLTILACGSVLLQHAASAATYKVTNTNNAGSGSLREAITSANKDIQTNDTIVFQLPTPTPGATPTPTPGAPGAQGPTISLSSALPDLSSNMSIINRGEPVTIQPGFLLPRDEKFPIFTITPRNTVTMEGLIITRGVGSGVRNLSSTLTMRNCTLHQNSSAGGAGGAIDNYASPEGPATLTLTNCTLSENKTSRGGLYFLNSGGGGIRNLGYETTATATLIDCVLQGNFTFYEPPPDGSGGLPIWETPPGGGIANIGWHGGVANLSLTRCTLEGNYTPHNGGAIFQDVAGSANSGTAANLALVDCTLRNNSASSGGAINSTSIIAGGATATLEKCTLVGNQASIDGGAIRNRAELALTNCTLSGNVAQASGGGVFNDGSPASVTNCTFFNNFVPNDASASSIFNGSGGSISTGNSIYDREGGSDVHFVNEGTFTSRGHNICDDNAGGLLGTGPGGLLNAAGDKRFTSPGLLPLANNGGPTQTCALDQNSPAINAGDDALAPPTDQRGFSRSGVSDIGAYERGATTPVSLQPGRLGNIATRLMVETGDNVLIGGFIVTGTEPKRVMVRAIGPSLPFANRLQNPTLELFDSSGASLEVNDNWIDSPNKQAIIDSTIPPTNDLESAIVIYLPAGSAGYTAVVRGADGGTGIGVVEVYDLDSAVDSKLANISTRGLVQTGDNVLIAGTIVTGQASQKVIIRAIGPSLPLAGKLEDPALELFNANGALLAANDNWRTGGQEQEIIATGVPPSNELESAIVYQLPSNNASYTALVSGVGGTTGIAVVEVYGLAPFSFGP